MNIILWWTKLDAALDLICKILKNDLMRNVAEKENKFKYNVYVPEGYNKDKKYFMKKNVELIEASIVTSLYNLESRGKESHNQVERITNGNFEEYAVFHDKYAIPFEMYYNSRNLEKDIDRFRIFDFRQDGAIRGSIFTKASKDLPEVVGLFVHKEYENKGIEGILINETLMQLYNEFGPVREIVYFVDEDCQDELDAVLAAGFEIKEKYRCYKCLL